MQPATINPDIRHDAVFLFDVTDGNPNGDPDAGNRPRVDDETGHGLITDVCLKRKVRDTIGIAADATGLDPDRYQIFVTAGHALNTRIEESYPGIGVQPKTKLNREQAEAARQWLTNRYVDIRLFGAVLSTGETRALGQIRGPLQFGMARSIDRIMPVEHAITRVTQTTQADIDKGQTTEMGGKWTVPYGLYRVQIHYAATRGRQTGVTSDDLKAFYDTLLHMFDHDRTATRGIMAPCGLYIFNHATAYGNAPAHTLTNRITITLNDGVTTPRSFTDYKISVDEARLPDGVTFDPLLG
jgi:CRISPR-associated protein Csd2